MNYGNVRSPTSKSGSRRNNEMSRNSSRMRTAKKRENSINDSTLSKNTQKVPKNNVTSSSNNNISSDGDKYFCIYPSNGYNIIKNAMMNKPGWKEVKKDDLWRLINIQRINFIWKPCNFNYKMYCTIDNAMHRSYLKKNPLYELVVNHLEGHRDLTTKTGLIRSLKYYYKDNVNFVETNYQVFETTPTTFVVSSNLETYEYHQFIRRYQDLKKGEGQTIKERVPQKHCHKNMWLVKPANENQGKGIKIFDDLDQIVRFLESSIKFSYWVIQKYLEKPLLYKNRKFDIRLWAMAQSNLDFYVYDTGYIRTSSEAYMMDNKDNEYIHLTNNCLQIKNKDTYGIHEEGNTVSFEQFQQYLKEEYPQYDLDFDRDFLQRMKDIAVDCYMSVKQTLNPNKRKNSFEFFGFDFMIDEDFRVWLIEVNTNPYIGIHNQSMKHILPEMFDGLFKIVLDPIHSEETIENPAEGTGFDLMYSRSRGINKRRPAQEGVYPIKELDLRPVYAQPVFKKKIFQQRQSEMAVTSIEQIEENNEQEDKNALKVPVQKPKAIPKVFSPQKISNRKESMIRISKLDVTNESFTVRNKKREDLNFSPNQEDDDALAARRGSQFKVREDPPKPKPPKTIVQQVKNLDKKSQFARDQGKEIINRIFAVFKSWELFSDEQIMDAITALQMLEQVFIVFQADEQKQIIDASVLLIGSNEAPMHIRQKLAQNLCVMMKNKNLTKQFFNDTSDAYQQLNHIYKVIHESCVQQNEEDSYQSTLQEELYIQCATILVAIMSLNNRKYYIPGETQENTKLRQRAIDCGILIVLMYSYISLGEGSLKQLMREEFYERLEESDLDYHFNNNHIHYDMVKTIIDDSNIKQKIDENLSHRLKLLRDSRERDQKMQIERQKEQEQREIQMKLEYDLQMQEKRKQAEFKMQQRIKHLQKLQANQLKQEIQMKEEQDQINEMKKQQMIDELKKKQEQRRQQQLNNMKKQKLVEKEIEEERERERLQRDLDRKQALVEWHNSKRAEEKRKQIVTKMVSKKPTSMGIEKDFMPKRKSVIKRNNPQSYDTAVDASFQSKSLVDESFLQNVKISQLNKMQQNIQIITNQRLNNGSSLQNGQKRLNFFSPQYDKQRYLDDNETFSRPNDDEEDLQKMKLDREKKEHLYRSAVQHLKQIKNTEKTLEQGKKTYQQKFRNENDGSQINKSTSQPKLKKNKFIDETRICTENSNMNIQTEQKLKEIQLKNIKSQDNQKKTIVGDQPVMIINRKNLILKNNSLNSSQGEDNVRMPSIHRDEHKIKIKDDYSEIVLDTPNNGLPKINNASELYYYEDNNSAKLDNLVRQQKSSAHRHNQSVYSNMKQQQQQQRYMNGPSCSQISSPVLSQDKLNAASHQISPKSFEISQRKEQEIMSDETPLTSQRVKEYQNLKNSMGVTIINNDYSNINFTQNINIEKYVKKKKNKIKKLGAGQALVNEIMSEFQNKKGSSKLRKSKKQKQKEQFIQIYNVPNITKPVGKILSGTSSQISIAPQNKLREKVMKKADMVIQGNIGKISIAHNEDSIENTQINEFYNRKGSLEEYQSLRIPSIQSRQSIDINDQQQFRLIKLKELNLKELKGGTGLQSSGHQPPIFFPEIEKKMPQNDFISLKQSFDGNQGSRSASLN